MTRCMLFGVLLALPLSVMLSGPARADIDETVIVPVEAHSSVDQQAAITYARELIASGHMDAAITELAEYVASHTTATEAARFLGDLYYRSGQFDRAEGVYRGMLAAHPGDKETHNRLGVVYATENRIDDAIAQFQSALPGTDSVRDLVLMHVRKGDLPRYEAEMLRAADQNPTDADVQEEMGEIYGALHRPYDAMRYFRRSLDNDAHSIAALNGLAMVYLDVHDHASAAFYLNDCLNIDPLNYACLDNLGVADIQAGANGDALNQFKRAHRLEPERPEAIVNFGYLADLAGDWKRAVTYYVQAIAVNPYVPESYVNLGIDYEHNGLYSLAQAALIKGVAAAPYDGRVRYLLARAYAAQGQKALALDQLKAAQASLDPEVAEIAKEETARLTGSASTAPQ